MCISQCVAYHIAGHSLPTLAYPIWSGRPRRLPPSAPHGAVLAQLRHTALRATNSLRDQTDASYSSWRQRIAPLQPAETLPGDACLVRAAAEPLVPRTT